MFQDRISYIRSKRQEGWKVFGVLPGYYPKEVLLAGGVLPVEIWDPKVDVTVAHHHLQPTICGIAKIALSFVLNLPKGLLEGILINHICDSLQNLGSLLKDLISTFQLPCIFFYQPKEPFRKSTFLYYKGLLKALVEDLKKISIEIKEGDLSYWCKEMASVYDKLALLFENLKYKSCLRLNKGLGQIAKGYSYLLPQDISRGVDEYISCLDSEGNDRRLVISGIQPYQREFLELLDLAGWQIVEEDSFLLTRRIPRSFNVSKDPYEELAYRYLSLPPCPARGTELPRRVEYLTQKVKKANAKGVIFSTIKFCEPEYFDLPSIASALQGKGIRTLHIEIESPTGMETDNLTRVEAFLEGFSGEC